MPHVLYWVAHLAQVRPPAYDKTATTAWTEADATRMRVSGHRAGGWSRRPRLRWRLAFITTWIRRNCGWPLMNMHFCQLWWNSTDYWGCSARNRSEARLSWSYPCVWPSWHERVVTAAGTEVAFAWRDKNGFSMRSVVTDGTIPGTVSLRLPTERDISG